MSPGLAPSQWRTMKKGIASLVCRCPLLCWARAVQPRMEHHKTTGRYIFGQHQSSLSYIPLVKMRSCGIIRVTVVALATDAVLCDAFSVLFQPAVKASGVLLLNTFRHAGGILFHRAWACAHYLQALGIYCFPSYSMPSKCYHA